MADTEKLTIIRGDSENITVTFKDNDDVAVNLTGKTVFFTVKKLEDINEDDDASAIIKKEITTHSAPTSGETIIVLTTTDTDQAPGEYVYDLQIVSGTTVISTEMSYLSILQDVTKES